MWLCILCFQCYPSVCDSAWVGPRASALGGQKPWRWFTVWPDSGSAAWPSDGSSYVAPLSRRDAIFYPGCGKMLITGLVISPFIHLFIHTIFYVPALLCLSASVALLHQIYPSLLLHLFPSDSMSPDNEGMTQFSLAHCLDQSASASPSDCVCVCV